MVAQDLRPAGGGADATAGIGCRLRSCALGPAVPARGDRYEPRFCLFRDRECGSRCGQFRRLSAVPCRLGSISPVSAGGRDGTGPDRRIASLSELWRLGRVFIADIPKRRIAMNKLTLA